MENKSKVGDKGGQVALSWTLPERSQMKNGGGFNPNEDVWLLKSGVESNRVDFSVLNERLNPDVLFGYRKTLDWFARNKSLESVKVANAAMISMVGKAADKKIALITDVMVLGYIGAGNVVPPGWGVLKTFFKKWHEQRNPGLDESAYKVALKAKTANLSGNNDQPLLTLCPIKGPFSSIERDAFHKAYNEAFANGVINEAAYIALSLERVFGARPSQLALMKLKDFEEIENNGRLEYVLRIPSAKKSEKSRHRFKNRLLVQEFGELMRTYCEKVALRYVSEDIPSGELPLFPMEVVNKGHVWSEGYKFHKTNEGMGSLISGSESKIRCISERTGEVMHINARRFRYTLGTVMAEEGHPASTIAEALDHEGIGTVMSYVAVTGKLHGRLNKAMAMQLAPIAQAFEGKLAKRGDVDSGLKSIRDIRVAGTYEPVGNCGKSSVCHYAAPIACYTCKNFRPFVDAPHEPLLDFLLAERERLMGVSGNTMAAIEDRTIIAIAEVLVKCNEVKNG